ncbi:MAG: hypothetical protein HY254_16420 [Burkholderiales bacterium]|nr:hypothetical protein [Burkholderiales bacterium]
MYRTTCEEFGGLGTSPFGKKILTTRTPLIAHELYLVSKDNEEQNIILFPFVRLLDIEQEHGIESFYFYSSHQSQQKSTQAQNSFLFISHQQISKQSQVDTHIKLEKIFQ